jgi:hypothetical protein
MKIILKLFLKKKTLCVNFVAFYLPLSNIDFLNSHDLDEMAIIVEFS